jgi:hypothetical protein
MAMTTKWNKFQPVEGFMLSLISQKMIEVEVGSF